MRAGGSGVGLAVGRAAGPAAGAGGGRRGAGGGIVQRGPGARDPVRGSRVREAVHRRAAGPGGSPSCHGRQRRCCRRAGRPVGSRACRDQGARSGARARLQAGHAASGDRRAARVLFRKMLGSLALVQHVRGPARRPVRQTRRLLRGLRRAPARRARAAGVFRVLQGRAPSHHDLGGSGPHRLLGHRHKGRARRADAQARQRAEIRD